MAIIVEPGLVVKPHCIHDECISLPPANRVSHPRGIQILGMWAAIGIDIAYEMVILEEHQYTARDIRNLHRLASYEKDPWNPRWKTLHDRIVCLCYGNRVGSDVRFVGLEFFFRPGSHRRLLAANGKHELINGVLASFVRRAPRSAPNAGQVRRRSRRLDFRYT